MKNILFQESLLVSGIMCFDGCGNAIQNLLSSCIDDCIKDKLLPADAHPIIDAEPNGLGIHRLNISIESETSDFIPAKNFHATLLAKIKEDIPFEFIDNPEEEQEHKHSKTNWINILINLIAMGLVTTLALIFPPSILLTVGLTSISFLATAFTAREYLINFFRNLRTGSLTNMATTISLGWFLSLAHTLFHTITMPLASSFSMAFMNFIMPIMLITCINSMDEIKRLVLDKSKKMQLKGMKTIFPQMSEQYDCYHLSQGESEVLINNMTIYLKNKVQPLSESRSLASDAEDSTLLLIKDLKNREIRGVKKGLLREGMLIKVKPGECFPVDCILVEGNTIIDASLLTGESQQSKQLWQHIPAGAINRGQLVSVYATKNSYNSTVNSLLFRANRARKTSTPTSESIPPFAYLYTALVVIGIAAAIIAPIAFGIATFSLIMQNIIGILFSVCPCTIAIAHQLPSLISIHHRNKKGIQLRDETLMGGQDDEIHTIVFDKTGTLTTGNSKVESSDINISSPLWQRIYLLEKIYGGEHPLAKAIMKHYETRRNPHIRFDEIKDCNIDPQSRGLAAMIQGKLIQIGSAEYLRSNKVILPQIDQAKIEQGFSAVYVAENGIYQGVIYIKHEARKGIVKALSRLKEEGKKIIMITGDNRASAKGFNHQIGSIFAEEDIHTEQTPRNKESFLTTLMATSGINPKGVWFVGDGLNDAPCCRVVSEKGGVSCAMNSSDKSAFFTDICLNGSLDYLFQHNKLNRFAHQDATQNKLILTYSTIAFLAFIISFCIAGIPVSPLIPMAIMLSTTLFVLFNSYRVQLSIDTALEKSTPWPKALLASNLSIGLLLGASALLICSVLIATIATGGLALPVITFTAGAAAAFSSICSLSAMGLFSAFTTLLTTSLLSERFTTSPTDEVNLNVHQQQSSTHEPPTTPDVDRETEHFGFFLDRFPKTSATPKLRHPEEGLSEHYSMI
ncbi:MULTISPECIES: HAD-IC family P-type ATPase [Legionella]|uniref:HAD-IC family P-type ATPase n=1 Tax=Legionella TaxID=445 RepID=UPI000AD3B04D|nr:HAD-IC family P-type ATPase [Legionella sp. 39-23]